MLMIDLLVMRIYVISDYIYPYTRRRQAMFAVNREWLDNIFKEPR
jgi:hypothetical protein